jgi:hypothetical protein
MMASLENPTGIIKSVLSPANIEALSTLGSPISEMLGLAAGITQNLPLKSTAFIGGVAENGLFLQIAAAMPPEMDETLNRVAANTATSEDIGTLLLGSEGSGFAESLTISSETNDNGSFYLVEDMFYITAKDGLILVALSAEELFASVAAAENGKNRLELNRKFESPDFMKFNMDVPFATSAAGIEENEGGLTSQFKAPLQIEAGFELKPDSFGVSLWGNITEALAETEYWKNLSPTVGSNLFAVGGGSPFLELASPVRLDAKTLKGWPEALGFWQMLVSTLAPAGITETDLENLATGTLSIAAGNDAAVMGKIFPGFYVALTGKEGAAGEILKKFTDNEETKSLVPLTALETEGWESLFAVMQDDLPASVLLGAKENTLLFGLADPQSLNNNPSLSDQAKAVFGGNAHAAGFSTLGVSGT